MARSSAAKPAAAKARAGAGERKSVREAAAEAASRVQAAGVGGRGRRGEPKRNKAPLLIAAVVLLAGLVAGGWFLLGRDQASESHAPSEPAAEIAPAAPEHSDGTPAEPPGAEPAGDENP